jgi:hypothetical protein
MPHTDSCSSCQTPSIPSGPDARRLIPVVDELGTTVVCGLCVIPLLSRLSKSGDVTVFVARPAAVAS